MNNKKGFTLIELLVAIVIMISILTLAIISFSNISKEKKKEALNLVYEQAETAAKEFFEANEYKFEQLNDDSIINISVGSLVSDGYITSLTDPTTGKKLNSCDYVQVSKSNGKYNFKFENSNDTSCFLSSITLTPVKNTSAAPNTKKEELIPEIDIKTSSSGTILGENNWYKKITPVILTKNANQLMYCKTNLNECTPNTSIDMKEYNKNGYDKINSSSLLDEIQSKYTTICAKASNSSNYREICISYRIDNEPPEITLYNKASENEWINKSMTNSNKLYKYLVITTHDNYSKVNPNSNISNTVVVPTKTTTLNSSLNLAKNESNADEYDGLYIPANGENTINVKVCDNAGNCNDKTRKVKYDVSPPIIGFANVSSCSITLTRDTAYGGENYSYNSKNIITNNNVYTSAYNEAAYFADYSSKGCSYIAFLNYDTVMQGGVISKVYNFNTGTFGPEQTFTDTSSDEFIKFATSNISSSGEAMIWIKGIDSAGNISNGLRVRIKFW